MTIPIITIDGPGGTGKGTLSKMLAKELQWHFLDSGALYRILAFAALRAKVNLQDEGALADLATTLPVNFIDDLGEAARIILNGQDVTEVIRTEHCSQIASQISVFPQVRAALLARQRDYCQSPGLIADGRDMGTIVFPAAKLKIYLLASQEARAQRRFKQLKRQENDVSLLDVLRELQQRDARDQNRAVAPLKPALDAVVIDTTDLSVDEVFAQIMEIVRARFPQLENENYKH